LHIGWHASAVIVLVLSTCDSKQLRGSGRRGEDTIRALPTAISVPMASTASAAGYCGTVVKLAHSCTRSVGMQAIGLLLEELWRAKSGAEHVWQNCNLLEWSGIRPDFQVLT
jgi:hypothetical protein